MRFTRQHLKNQGFQGFVRFAELPTNEVPALPGVYVVVRDATAPPRFLATSCGGHFKRRDPSVSTEELAGAWVAGAEVVYIGKAAAGRDGRRGLKKRLDEYRLFGNGRPVGHWGGRYVWQLADSDALLVAWMTTPSQDPGDVESQMLSDFMGEHGRRPFANRNRGGRTRRTVLRAGGPSTPDRQ